MSTGLFKVYRSSAGSGKTFTLVREFLTLALRGKDPHAYRHILAITFTNKAATEMKERVFRNIRGFAMGEDDPEFDEVMFSMVRKELGVSEEELQERAANTLSSMLHNYGEVAISTIDKFIHGVIRSFARELRLAPDFQIEIDTKSLLEMAVDELLSQVGIEEELTQMLSNFLEFRLENESGWDLRKELVKFSEQLSKEQAIEPLEILETLDGSDFAQANAALSEIVSEFFRQMQELVEPVFIKLSESDVPKHHLAYKGAVFNYFQKLLNKDANPAFAQALNAVEKSKHHSSNATEESIVWLEHHAEELNLAFRASLDLLESKGEEIRSAELVLRSIHPTAALKRVNREIEQIKERDGILPISEFNELVSEVVASNPAPFIYERIGERYRHFLIDEFQDTSVLQWQNFLPLIENSLSKACFNMIVGDGKQAIYRFRGGEVEQFSRLPDIYKHKDKPFVKDKEEILRRNYMPDLLDANFRSCDEVIDFNNRLFEELMKRLPEDLAKIYVHQAQKPHRGGGGKVVLRKMNEEGDKDLMNMQATLGFIEQATADGYGYGDIAVLCRSNKNASVLAEFLLQKRIPVISSESLLIHKDPAVRLLVNAMQCIIEPRNAACGVGLIRGYAEVCERLSDVHGLLTTFRRYRKDEKSGELAVWIDADAFLDAEGYPGLLRDSGDEGLYELTERLIRAFGLHERANVYLEFFLEQVHHFSVKRRNDLDAFLSWWADHHHKLSIQMAEGSDAVTIMTIHKSKGLEFPVVILPYLHWANHTGKDLIWVETTALSPHLPVCAVNATSKLENTIFKEEYEHESGKAKLDELNVLYVACTRARDRMYLLLGSKGSPSDYLEKAVLEMAKLDDWPESDIVFGQGAEVKRKRVIHTTRETASWASVSVRDHLQFSLEAPLFPGQMDPLNARQRGEAMHEALAKANSLEEVIEKMPDLGELHQSAMFRSWFGDKVKVLKEQNFLDLNGSLLRPDRIVIFEKEIHVIDYKTGLSSKRYHRQVRSYISLLSDTYELPVRGFLVYLDEGKIEEVGKDQNLFGFD